MNIIIGKCSCCGGPVVYPQYKVDDMTPYCSRCGATANMYISPTIKTTKRDKIIYTDRGYSVYYG